ncbi:thiol-disulfide oxidoreductase DCC family protein [Tuberibacillus sp. Marseille-P3662]|uniref:thiol-disulfide oxidoreductase DCC family protein n=1 Tax=Tuberibacillus sp. Marseille-P3662 TaxID=1965358 RepID=UPI000A1CB23C|nr:DUF393 domain-containing protein [Tuberibacillus sp. Marseille-P3662]
MSQKPTLKVFYDGWCPMCTRAMRAMRKMDRLGNIEFISFRTEGVMETYQLHGMDVEDRIYSIRKRDGQSFSGIATILEITKRIPIYIALVPFIWLSMKVGLGQKLYRFIADRRSIVPVGQCDDGQCQVHFQDNQDD